MKIIVHESKNFGRMTAWTYLERLGKLEGEDSRKEATGKMLDALGYTQGTEGRWYDDEGDEVNIIDVLDNTEWDKAVTICGPLQEPKKGEAYYKGKDRGFLVLVQKLIADNWYAKARKKFPGLTLDCFEMDGAGDDMKICFEAYGEEIDDPMSEGLMEIAEESAKKGCADANRSTDPRIADYGRDADFIIWDEPDVFRDQWSYVINLSSKPKGKKGESADEKLGYEKGHRNSKGEPAPWVIRSHEDNRVLASFANKDDAYAHLQRMKQYSESREDGENAYDDYWTLIDGLKALGFEPSSHIRNGMIYPYRTRFTATKDGVKYGFTLNEDSSGEYLESIVVFGGIFDKGDPNDPDPTRFKSVSDVLTAFKGMSESFHKVQVKDTLFDILKKHGVNDKAKVSYDGDTIVCEYDGTTLRIDNDLAMTAKMQDKTINRKYGTLADLSADLDKYFTKYVKEALEKNGVIVVPEWLWVAYETGDSKFLSIEEMQILDGFRAMAAGKVFDAEAEPSFRAFNDFDDYAGNCYEVQVYTIKEK